MPVQLNPQQLGSESQVLENRAHDEAERIHQPEEFLVSKLLISTGVAGSQNACGLIHGPAAGLGGG